MQTALSQDKKGQNWKPITDITCMQTCPIFFVVARVLEWKTVPIFAHSTFCLTVRVRVLELQVREQWNKRSGPRLKTEREWEETLQILFFFSRTPYGRVRLERFARGRLFGYSYVKPILRKKTDCFAVYTRAFPLFLAKKGNYFWGRYSRRGIIFGRIATFGIS